MAVDTRNTDPDAGTLTGAPLEEARQTRPASLWHPHRHILLQCPPCTGNCDQGDKCPARAGFAETEPAYRGSADALGDDQAERHSGWGALSECAVEGGRHSGPKSALQDNGPSAGWIVAVGVACVLAVGACALIASQLPHLTT